VLAVLGVSMKIWILFFLSSVPFFTYSNNDIAVKKEIDLFLGVSECLRSIPTTEIKNPDHKISPELSLITSVIENITLGLGTNDNEQKEFRELYKVAYKHCPKEIDRLKAEYKSTANKQINQDK
tara:strand:+ start:523 stop:894 length:372 start_codon:yes stop_codon:yes gene_type:complete